jgi:hypothetical protein
MGLLKSIVAVTLTTTLASAAAGPLSAAAARTRPSIPPLTAAAKHTPPSTPPLTRSRDLWSTVDVCDPKDKPHTVGVRGSMPSDGHPKDVMFMRLQIQFLDSTTKTWTDLTKGGDSGFLKLGSGLLARQGGLSVQLAAGAGKASYTLRGYVAFQWRRAGKAIKEVTRTTSAGHTSAAGADPHGYSAATCKLS